MEDRELLELAAKAFDDPKLFSNTTGAPWQYWIGFCEQMQCDVTRLWNPLEDDGDALRLAMKLGICIQFIPQCDTVQVYQEREFTAEPFNVHVAGLGDIETRRIITQAAAEIGKAMP